MCLYSDDEPLSNFNAKVLAFAVSIECDGISNPAIDQDCILRVCSNLLVLDPIADRFRFTQLSVIEYPAQRNLNYVPTEHFDKASVYVQVTESWGRRVGGVCGQNRIDSCRRSLEFFVYSLFSVEHGGR